MGAQPLAVKLVPIGDLARQCGVHRTTMVRRLLAMHARSGGDWLVPVGRGEERRAVLVNVERLRASHPGLFEPTRQRNLESDVEELLETVRALKKRIAAQGARIRELEAEVCARARRGADSAA